MKISYTRTEMNIYTFDKKTWDYSDSSVDFKEKYNTEELEINGLIAGTNIQNKEELNALAENGEKLIYVINHNGKKEIMIASDLYNPEEYFSDYDNLSIKVFLFESLI